jgi:predicted O-methyltransferase YrrM
LDKTESFDFAFIDADKENYRSYYEALLPRMPSGSLIVFDNMLWHGFVIDPNDHDIETVAVRELNDFLPTDPRIDMVMLPLFDGVTLARKR